MTRPRKPRARTFRGGFRIVPMQSSRNECWLGLRGSARIDATTSPAVLREIADYLERAQPWCKPADPLPPEPEPDPDELLCLCDACPVHADDE